MVKCYNVKASRKEATARAVIKPGAGNVRINNKAIDVFCNGIRKQLVLEASYVAEDEFNKFDYFITVKGGGVMSQLQSARNCIAKGLLLANGNKKALREKLLAYDRNLLVDDVRQVEPKKQLGKGARKKKQHSKR